MGSQRIYIKTDGEEVLLPSRERQIERELHRRTRKGKRKEKKRDEELYFLNEELIKLKTSGIHKNYDSLFKKEIKKRTNKKVRKTPCIFGNYYKKLIKNDKAFYYI